MDAARISSEEFATFVRQLYRLFKVGTIHLLNNEAVLQTVDRSVAVFEGLSERGFDRISVLFLEDTVFVNGTLLKANRDVYESAQELAAILEKAGANQVTIRTEATRDDVLAMLAVASERLRAANEGGAAATETELRDAAMLRRIDPELLDDVSNAKLTARDKTGRAYASALVSMRHTFDALKAGEYEASRQLKRLAQQLVMLGDRSNPAFLAVTRMRATHDDEAGRAVNSAILTVAAAREVTDDIRTLTRLAVAALLYEAGRPRAAGMGKSDAKKIKVIPRLRGEKKARLPASTAVVLTALGGLHEDAMYRIVCGFEAQWRDVNGKKAPVYDGALDPRMESQLLFVARKFNRLLTFDVTKQRRLTPDEAIERLRARTADPVEFRCIELILGALGIVERGTVVRLRSGARALVVENSASPGSYGLPLLRVFASADGAPVRDAWLDLKRPNDAVARFGGIAEVCKGESAPAGLLDEPIPARVRAAVPTPTPRPPALAPISARVDFEGPTPATPEGDAETLLPAAAAPDETNERPLPESTEVHARSEATAEQPSVADDAADAESELENILGQYFEEPRAARQSDVHAPSEHVLRSPEPNVEHLLHAYVGDERSETAPMPVVDPRRALLEARTEHTSDLSQPRASNILREFFPDADSGANVRLRAPEGARALDSPPEPKASVRQQDTLVDGLPDAHELLSTHLREDAALASPKPLAPSVNTLEVPADELSTSSQELLRVHFGSTQHTAPPTEHDEAPEFPEQRTPQRAQVELLASEAEEAEEAEETAQVQAGRIQSLLEQYRESNPSGHSAVPEAHASPAHVSKQGNPSARDLIFGDTLDVGSDETDRMLEAYLNVVDSGSQTALPAPPTARRSAYDPEARITPIHAPIVPSEMESTHVVASSETDALLQDYLSRGDSDLGDALSDSTDDTAFEADATPRGVAAPPEPRAPSEAVKLEARAPVPPMGQPLSVEERAQRSAPTDAGSAPTTRLPATPATPDGDAPTRQLGRPPVPAPAPPPFGEQESTFAVADPVTDALLADYLVDDETPLPEPEEPADPERRDAPTPLASPTVGDEKSPAEDAEDHRRLLEAYLTSSPGEANASPESDAERKQRLLEEYLRGENP